MPKRIEALDIIALELDARLKVGTPDYDKAALAVSEAKQLWREQLWNKPQCDKCQKISAVLERTRRFLLELQAKLGKLQQMKSGPLKEEFDQVVKSIFEL